MVVKGNLGILSPKYARVDQVHYFLHFNVNSQRKNGHFTIKWYFKGVKCHER
jgi:hypothetical protein